MTDKNDTLYLPLHPMYGNSESSLALAISSARGVCCPEMEIVDGVCTGCGRPYYLYTFEQVENIIRFVYDNFEGRIQTLEVSTHNLETQHRQKTPKPQYPSFYKDWIEAYENATFMIKKNMELDLATSIYNNSECSKYLDSGGRVKW